MSEWTLDILVRRLDECVAKEAPQKGKEFENFDSLTPEEQKRLLLETADRFFDDGRYSMKTEWSIEMYELDEACEALYDLRQINELKPALRKRLTFYQHFVNFCFPVFKKYELDIDDEPFNFEDFRYNIANNELRNFLYTTEYIHLAHVMMEGLICQFVDPDKGHGSVAYNELHQSIFYCRFDKEKTLEENRTRLDEVIDSLWNAYNHFEIGQRLGLSPMAQSLYDMTDTFICKMYDYRQVDYAKELATFIEDGLKRNNNKLNQPFADEIGKAVDSIAEKYGVTFCDKRFTLRYIFIDLLGFAQPSEEESDSENIDSEDDE